MTRVFGLKVAGPLCISRGYGGRRALGTRGPGWACPLLSLEKTELTEWDDPGYEDYDDDDGDVDDDNNDVDDDDGDAQIFVDQLTKAFIGIEQEMTQAG